MNSEDDSVTKHEKGAKSPPRNFYAQLSPNAFWRSGVVHADPHRLAGIYNKKFSIDEGSKIGVAGSCFAQHITRHLKKNGYRVLDLELPPPALAPELHGKFGYSIYSARYGNIYSTAQLLQLASECAGLWKPTAYIWTRGSKYIDALRPSVEPDGLDSPAEVEEHRRFHLAGVKAVFQQLDVFIFTLGLTECWVHAASGTYFSMAPGHAFGDLEGENFIFKNLQFLEVLQQFNQFQKVLLRIRQNRPYKILLTVSPIPLTATASGRHVLEATTHSKAILRSVAGQLAANQSHIDYFPSYEIVMNPKWQSTAFAPNLRSVREETVEVVMEHFFAEHQPLPSRVSGEELERMPSQEDIYCEESMIKADWM